MANNFLGSGNFTVECWAYPTSAAGAWTPILSFGSTGGGQELRIGQGVNGTGTPGLLYPNAANNGDLYLPTAGAMPLSAWTHIAMVKNLSSIACFRNGVCYASAAYLGNFGNTGALLIGTDKYTSTDGYFTGYITDVRITQSALYTTPTFTVPTQPLNAVPTTTFLISQRNNYYTDASNNNVLIDDPGAVLAGGTAAVPLIGGVTPFPSYTSPGFSWNFNNSTIYIPNNLYFYNFSVANWTVEAYVYLNALPASDNFGLNNTYVIAGYGNTAPGGGGNTINFCIGQTKLFTGAGGTQFTSPSAHNFATGTWYHVAYVRSASLSTVSFYINGVFNGSVAHTPGTSYGTNCTVGSDNYSTQYNYFNGNICNLRVVKDYAIYTTSFSKPTSPLSPYVPGCVLLTCNSSYYQDTTNTTIASAVSAVTGVISVQTKTPFNDPVYATTFTSGINLGLKLWGAAGGSCQTCSSGVFYNTPPAGGYTYTVAPGANFSSSSVLYVYVGQGGTASMSNQGGTFGGGGGSYGGGGQGGGATYVFINGPQGSGTLLAVAGGGAGGVTTANAANSLGSGGGLVGGANNTNNGVGATGGGQSSGGAAGTGGSGGGGGAGTNGSYLQGGTGMTCKGSGGGGGYYGGGGGGGDCGSCASPGGGGGSSYVNSAYFTNTLYLDQAYGASVSPAGQTDIDWVSPYGMGNGYTNGNNGYAVIVIGNKKYPFTYTGAVQTLALSSTPLSAGSVASGFAATSSGATVYTAGVHTTYQFYGSGTLTVTSGGTVNYLIIAGGGGGGGNNGGGGGAGGVVTGSTTIAAGTYTISIGGGGAAGPSSGNGGNGGNTTVSGGPTSFTTAIGGGAGGGYFGNGQNGGSGGGEGGNGSTGGSGTPGQGNAGLSQGGGGGGGYGAAATSGAGGVGAVFVTPTGQTYSVAGGGGGPGSNNNTAGNGSPAYNGGGAGNSLWGCEVGCCGCAGFAGTTNTGGGGGGGGGYSGPGGAGGSGMVVFWT
jgi:Concanavalin A-like lectin/glucanases superfamily/Glycine rich protein